MTTISFFLPFRRQDVWKELARHEDPLDYPSSEWLSVRLSEPQINAAASTLGEDSLLAPGFVRRLERRPASSECISLELASITAPSLLKWRILSHRASGGLFSLMEPEVVAEKSDDRRQNMPGICVSLEDAPYGTRVTVGVGTHGRLELPSACDCIRPLVTAALACTQRSAMESAWRERMTARGYTPLQPRSGAAGRSAGAAALLAASATSSSGAAAAYTSPLPSKRLIAFQEGGGTSLSSGDGRSSTLTSPEELKRFATTSTSPAGSKKSFSFF